MASSKASSKASSCKKLKLNNGSVQTQMTAFVSAVFSKTVTILSVEPSLHQRSIVGSNNAMIDTAAADLCHGDNLSFMCFESSQMKHFIKLLQLGTVGLDWKLLCCNRISGELFDINFSKDL